MKEHLQPVHIELKTNYLIGYIFQFFVLRVVFVENVVCVYEAY